LPSAEDHDRSIAVKKGFRSVNLIGVERNQKALIAARDRGSLTVSGDFFDAVEIIARSREVSVVFGDFCCGLDGELPLRLAELFHIPGLHRAVFALNLMRGRDPSSSSYRGHADKFCLEDALKKHRALIAATAACRTVARSIGSQDADKVLARYKLLLDQLGYADECLNSYKSTSGQVFDSMVFRNPMSSFWKSDVSGLNKVWDSRHQAKRNDRRYGNTARSAAAVMAHRTMRLSA
jgi:hypothetical protein